MSAPFVIAMHPHPTVNGRFHSPETVWTVSRAGRWCGEFESFGKVQLFVNAMTYIEEVKACGHLDAYPACEYLLRNVVSLE